MSTFIAPELQVETSEGAFEIHSLFEYSSSTLGFMNHLKPLGLQI